MKRPSKILFVVVPITLILLVAAIYQYGYLQIQAEEDAVRDIRYAKAKTLAKYSQLIFLKPQYEKALAEFRELKKSTQTKFVDGETPALAAANLQNIVKGIIASRGGTVSSERVEKPEPNKHFNLISVSVDTVMPDIGALNDAVFTLETQTPSLIIRELDVRARNYKDPKELLVRMKIGALAARR